MSDTLHAQLQATLGDRYTLERELGNGGMSRVFVAREHVLGREVVVKVPAPDLSASVSAERFTREIKLAAALQEPHIMPVLAARVTSNGLSYHTMLFVRGDSLRARMRSGHEHPFHSRTTAQHLIAARIAEAPKPVLDPLEAPQTRDLAKRAFATSVMLYLEKLPSARSASATELLTVMAAVHVSGSTSAPTTLAPRRVVIATIEN